MHNWINLNFNLVQPVCSYTKKGHPNTSRTEPPLWTDRWWTRRFQLHLYFVAGKNNTLIFIAVWLNLIKLWTTGSWKEKCHFLSIIQQFLGSRKENAIQQFLFQNSSTFSQYLFTLISLVALSFTPQPNTTQPFSKWYWPLTDRTLVHDKAPPPQIVLFHSTAEWSNVELMPCLKTYHMAQHG